MADNKNNLEDFFKNRINDFDESKDGWDLPDESAWGNAETHFPIHPQKKTRDWKLGVMILLAFAMIAGGSYVYFLKKDLTKKTIELDLAYAEIEINNNTITNLKKEKSKTDFKLNRDKLNSQNATTSLTQQQQISTQTIYNQKKAIQNLQNKNQRPEEVIISVQSNFDAIAESNISPNENHISGFLTKKTKETLVKTIPIAFLSLKFDYDFPIQQLDLEKEFIINFPKPKKKSNRFEVGINFSSISFEIPLIYDFEKLEKEDFGKKDWSFPLKYTGGEFHLAYNVLPRFWITTGVRRTTGGFEKTFSDKLIYDKSGEYLDSDGKTINEFDITTQSGFGDAGSTINFEIPTGTAIDDGDFLETKWNYSQQYKFTHIPIGVNYFMGKNKFQWFLKGGFGWNKVSYGEYFVEAQLSYDNEIFPIKENEKNQ